MQWKMNYLFVNGGDFETILLYQGSIMVHTPKAKASLIVSLLCLLLLFRISLSSGTLYGIMGRNKRYSSIISNKKKQKLNVLTTE
jgi:hypothetical protein